MNRDNVKHAREALGARLRELRQRAGLNGKEFAESVGWHPTKVSKIELGKQTPNDADITAWTRATRADDARDELLTELHNLELQYAEWRRQLRAGTRARQQTQIEREAKAKTIRVFEPALIPGLLQTAEYARSMLADAVKVYGAPDDIDEGVRLRMRRQELLYEPGREFHFLLTEAVLYYRSCSTDVLAGQLDRLLALASLRTVRVGIVPFRTQLPVPPVHGFWIYDSELVQVETLAAELNLVQPLEIQLHMKTFQQLATVAAHGPEARALVTRALIDLAGETGP